MSYFAAIFATNGHNSNSYNIEYEWTQAHSTNLGNNTVDYHASLALEGQFHTHNTAYANYNTEQLQFGQSTHRMQHNFPNADLTANDPSKIVLQMCIDLATHSAQVMKLYHLLHTWNTNSTLTQAIMNIARTTHSKPMVSHATRESDQPNRRGHDSV